MTINWNNYFKHNKFILKTQKAELIGSRIIPYFGYFNYSSIVCLFQAFLNLFVLKVTTFAVVFLETTKGTLKTFIIDKAAGF